MSTTEEWGATIGELPCAQCGMSIKPNPSNLCVNCISARYSVSEDIPRSGTVTFCKTCGRYHVPPDSWVLCELESRELLALLLRRIRGLNKRGLKLVDSSFVWTEPHSRRIKVQLTVQGEVQAGAILEESFVVEFVVQTNMCPACHASFAGDAVGWKATVQLRQKVDHKRTFFFLEQQIIRHKAHAQCLNIKEMPDGIDLFFSTKSHATRFADFVSQVAPTRTREAQKLVSHDEQSNTYNYKHTYAVDIVPICKEDLVFLPKKVAHHMGGISRLVVITRVLNMIHLMDPITLQRSECTAAQFWRAPFTSFAGRTHQSNFIVLDVEPAPGPTDRRFALAEITVAREADFGVNDVTYTCLSHLGNILQAGDTAAGYDLQHLNVNDTLLDGFDQRKLPDIVLVRKTYPKSVKREARRKFKLKRLDMETLGEEAYGKRQVAAAEAAEMQFEDFVRDVEEDPELRAEVNLYKKPEAPARPAADVGAEDGDFDEDELPEVPIDELLEDMGDLKIGTDVHDGSDGEGDQQ